MTSAQILKELIFDFFEAIVFLLLYVSLTRKEDIIKKYKIKVLVYIFFYTVFAYWATIYMPEGLHTFLIFTYAIIALGFITQSKLYVSFMVATFCLILLAITEFISMGITAFLFNIDFATLVNSTQLIVVAYIISKSIYIGAAIFLFYSKISIFSKDIFKKGNSALSFIVFQTFIMTMIFVNVNYIIKFAKFTLIHSALIFIMFFLLIILAILDYKERERVLKIEGRFDAQVEHVRNMEQIMSTVRKEKHDFSNHMNTIQLMCKMNTPDTLEKIETYIGKLTTGLKSAYRFYNTGNDFINCLLAVKSSYAFEHGIELSIDIQAPLSEVQMEDNDLISIIGNLVDNAFDAVTSQTGRLDKVVSISTYSMDRIYYLSISNNGPMIAEKNLTRIFENGYSTKSNDKADHGYGLYITSRIIGQSGGEIIVSSTEEETRFLVVLNMKAQVSENAS